MNASAPSATKPFSSHPNLILFAAILCLTCSSVLAQATNPDYTNDLPSIDRVKAEIKGSDPTDTLARQVAVFTYLQAYVQRIKYNRSYSGPFTPGEQRVIAAYSLAAYQMSQDYAKTHTPDEAKAFERLHGQYEMNSDFYKDWSKRLIGPQTAAAYKGAEAGLAAAGQRRYDQAMADYKRDSAAQQAADKQIFGTQGLSNDPTAVATRRCLELGGSNVGCMGKGFMSGFMDMVGFGTEAQEALAGPGRAGVVLSGLYKNPATTTSLGFNEGSVAINGCGKLVADGHNYTIDKRPGSLQVTVENEPHPIILIMRPDGGFTGPGLIDVKGRIIIGYHTVTSTLMVNGVRATPDQCNGPCQTSTQVPDYAPAMARCIIGSLARPPQPAPAAAQPANDSGILGLVSGLAETFAPGGAEVGLRMTGKYGGGMLLLDFSGNSLILDCGQAHVRQPYTVENAPNSLLIHVENSGGPFILALQPDNTLRGSGNTAVNGRLVTGMNGDNVAFAPHSEHCDVGTFRPKTGAAPAASVAAASPTVPPSTNGIAARVEPAPSPTPAVYAPAPAPAPAIAASAPSPSPSSPSPVRAAMRVAIAADFPSGANPMIGQSVFVMRERIDDVLRKLGIPVPPNSTPGKAMQTFATTCRTQDCAPVVKGLDSYYVTHAKLDSAGKATLSATAATGPYFFFALFRKPDGTSLVWDIPATLHAGDNTITLTPTNAEIFH